MKDLRSMILTECQCKKGLVTDLYATGKALLAVGVIPGGDMTAEVDILLIKDGPNKISSARLRSYHIFLVKDTMHQKFVT
jgi:hypothetical protein